MKHFIYLCTKLHLKLFCLGSKVIESFELGLSSLSFEAENLSSALDVCEHFSKLERSLNNFAALQKITKIQESLYDIGNQIQTQPRAEEAIQLDVESNQMSGQPKKKQIIKKFTKSLEKCDSLHKCPPVSYTHLTLPTILLV